MTRRASTTFRFLVTALAPVAALSLAACNESWERSPAAGAASIVVVGPAEHPQAPHDTYSVPPASVITAQREEQPPTF